MRSKDKPATAALRAYLDREVDHGLRILRIRSRTAMRRESERYPETEENNYPGPRCLEARVRCLELLDTLADPSATDIDLGTMDQWIIELRDKLRKAIRRRLTDAELRRVVDLERRYQEECAIQDAKDKREREPREFVAALTGENRFYWLDDLATAAPAGAAVA